MSVRRCLFGLLCVLLSACQTRPFDGVPTALEDVTRQYAATARWEALDRLYAYTDDSVQVERQSVDALANIRVTAYETAGSPIATGDGRWSQTAVIDYVLNDRQVVRRLVDRQVWAPSADGNGWYRSNPVPIFK